MKLLLPEVELKSDSGFDPEIDIFKRKAFGERLANLIQNSQDNPVLALDAEWGEGKTTFIRMWMSYIQNSRERKLKTIYFDAFENDYQKDPFLTLASEIYSLIEDEDEVTKKEFKEKATGAVKSLMRGAIKIGVKTVSAGIIDGSAVDSIEKELSNLIAGQVDSIVADKFKNIEVDKLALTNFKKYLEEFAKKIGNENPIVFIIDELDRCKPDFALELLEHVKHLFSVKGITFLLITNRVQLEEMIKLKYGTGIDANNYLHKFVNVWMTLPREILEYQDYGVDFLKYALSNMLEEDDKIKNDDILKVFEEIIKYYRPSLREIERILAYYAIIHNMIGNDKYNYFYQYMISFVCYLKCCNSIVLNKLDDISSEEFIKITNLNKIEEYPNLNYLDTLKNIVIFDLSDDEIKQTMVENKDVYLDSFGRMPQNVLKNITKWISNINQG